MIAERTGVVGRESEPAAIEAHDLRCGYGEVPVVHGLNLRVAPGEVVSLLGANGAGKTTALLTLAGALKSLGGRVEMFGSAAPRGLERRARLGLGLVTDDRTVFRQLTTRENLRLGSGDPEEAVRLFPALSRLMNRKAGLLSGGEQQMLGVGRALAQRPKVLLTDELSLGLAPIVVHHLMQAVRAAADDGVAVILVEQQVRLALDICDYAYILDRGRVRLEGTGDKLRQQRGEIEESYLAAPRD